MKCLDAKVREADDSVGCLFIIILFQINLDSVRGKLEYH